MLLVGTLHVLMQSLGWLELWEFAGMGQGEGNFFLRWLLLQWFSGLFNWQLGDFGRCSFPESCTGQLQGLDARWPEKVRLFNERFVARELDFQLFPFFLLQNASSWKSRSCGYFMMVKTDTVIVFGQIVSKSKNEAVKLPTIFFDVEWVWQVRNHAANGGAEATWEDGVFTGAAARCSLSFTESLELDVPCVFLDVNGQTFRSTFWTKWTGNSSGCWWDWFLMGGKSNERFYLLDVQKKSNYCMRVFVLHWKKR